jgi:hypothetical protein
LYLRNSNKTNNLSEGTGAAEEKTNNEEVASEAHGDNTGEPNPSSAGRDDAVDIDESRKSPKIEPYWSMLLQKLKGSVGHDSSDFSGIRIHDKAKAVPFQIKHWFHPLNPTMTAVKLKKTTIDPDSYLQRSVFLWLVSIITV